ncbi:MAG: TIGR02147 family protein [Fibrobacteria bacterium]
MEKGVIYQYSDFRQFLRDHYAFHKRHTRGYSYRAFSKAAGFSSPNFIKLVMMGEKNLTGESAVQLARGMKLDSDAAEYFLDLVRFGQAKNLDAKRLALERIEQSRRRQAVGKLTEGDVAYLREWYLPVLREMTALPDFQEDADWIARRLSFPVPLKEIRSGMEYLETQGFLKRDGNGRLLRKERVLASGDMSGKPGLEAMARQYHVQMAELAKQAVFQWPKEKRSVSNTTLSLSRRGYELALERIESMRADLLDLAARETGATELHQLSMILFPLTGEEERSR